MTPSAVSALALVNWLNPALLAGLAGAAIPIVIHLIHRRRAPLHPFPAFDLLVAARKALVSYVRLRHLLVMILRVLFVLLFAAALAMPSWQASGATPLSSQPTACLILLDDTLSMQYRPDGKSLFEQAQTRASAILGGLREFDRACVMSFSGRSIGPGGFNADFDALWRAVKALQPGYGRHLAGPAISRALAALESEPLPEKLLVILSDMGRSSWSEADFPLLSGAAAQVKLVDFSGGRAPQNRYIESLEVTVRPSEMKVNAQTVSSGRSLSERFDCALQVEGEAVALATVNPDEAGRGSAAFSVSVPGRGWFSGIVRIPDDGLSADNVAYFCRRTASTVRLLVVDGDPRESIDRSESFYIELACRALAESGNVAAELIPHYELPNRDLRGYDCVILANVPAQSLKQNAAIEQFVRSGGGLWILLGDSVESEAYGRYLRNILPARPISIKEPEPAGSRLSTEDLKHFIFSSFDAEWRFRFSQASFKRYWVLSPRLGSSIVASFADGSPALVEAAVASGRVLVAASPLDRDWNDLCVRPVFVPFFQQCVLYLAGVRAAGATSALSVGDPFLMDVSGQERTLYALPPGSGSAWEEVRLEGDETRRKLAYRNTDVPGIYRVATRPDPRETVALFAVNVPPSESDLRPIEKSKIPQSPGMSGGGRPEGWVGAKRLWPLLLWLALLALACESVLARK